MIQAEIYEVEKIFPIQLADIFVVLMKYIFLFMLIFISTGYFRGLHKFNTHKTILHIIYLIAANLVLVDIGILIYTGLNPVQIRIPICTSRIPDPTGFQFVL